MGIKTIFWQLKETKLNFFQLPKVSASKTLLHKNYHLFFLFSKVCSCPFVKKLNGQIWNLIVFSTWSDSICVLKLLFTVKFNRQKSHLIFFPSWTDLICSPKLLFLQNLMDKGHLLMSFLHELTLYGFSSYFFVSNLMNNSHIWMFLIHKLIRCAVSRFHLSFVKMSHL